MAASDNHYGDVFQNLEPAAPASTQNATSVMRSMFDANSSTDVGYPRSGLEIEHGTTSLDHFRGHANVSTGLAYNIRGRATRIEAKVGDALATFQDPIKALFGTRICAGQTVVVTRKYVVGGRAVAVPERAPARVVKVQEDVRKVELTRYGADMEMNLNLFLKPADAKYEMDLKLDAQKQALENELIRMGYEAVMRDGIRLQDAIARSSPASSNGRRNEATMSTFAETVYERSVFGAFQRHEFPLQNLITAAKNASAYRNVVGSGSMMILPNATHDLLAWTKPCHMEYTISGVSTANKKDVTMQLDNAYQEPMLGLKIMIHHPAADNSFGSVQKTRGMSPLTRKVIVAGTVPAAATHVVDFEHGGLKERDGRHEGAYTRKVTFYMSSAILGKPGAETGELLVGYPFTSVSTNQRTESLTVGLRVYLGAILKQIENVLVIPDVCFNGFVSDEAIAGEDDTMVKPRHWGYFDQAQTFHASTTVLAELDHPEEAIKTSGLQVYSSRVQKTRDVGKVVAPP